MDKKNVTILIVVAIVWLGLGFILGHCTGHPRFDDRMMPGQGQGMQNCLNQQQWQNPADQQPTNGANTQQPPMMSGDQQPTPPTQTAPQTQPVSAN